MVAKLVASGFTAPVAKYSGLTREGLSYTAYGHPRVPVADNLITDTNAPLPEFSCNGYQNSGAISYGFSTALITFAPSSTQQGLLCRYRDGVKWWLGRFQMDQIVTLPGYYCPAGYQPRWAPLDDWCMNNRIVHAYREQLVTCPVEPATPLEDLIAQYHANDPEMAQLTRDLESGANLSLRDLLTEATQQAEACVSTKFAAEGFGNDYKLESAGRPKAYQAHFHNLYQRWLEHGKVDEESQSGRPVRNGASRWSWKSESGLRPKARYGMHQAAGSIR